MTETAHDPHTKQMIKTHPPACSNTDDHPTVCTTAQQAQKQERLPSVETAVPETGGDLSSPPAVSPFPNWAEDSDEMVGSRVRVYWDGDNEWYSGRIVRFKATQLKPYLVRSVV